MSVNNIRTGNSPKWWKELIIYQIYPRSFKDTTGNGIGDLRGIIEQLDYIKSLGVNAVWINPIYASPNDDNGYDISDYRAILPEFGTMQDFDELLSELHKRDIKFVMDLVVNHTSDEHAWFKQSRSSRNNPYRDYYHWWPAEKGKPAFRWSYFDEKGEAWKYDEQTNAYYLHYFSQKQPDLNWENPKVRHEVYDIMKFWADKGVDGFRLDAFQFVSKDTTFPKLPEVYEQDFSQIINYHSMGPNIHRYLREMHDKVLSKYDVFAVSEGAGSTFQDAHDLVDEQRKELHMAYHFECVNLGNDVDNLYTLKEFKTLFSRWDESFSENGWLSIYLANHDLPRMLSKFGDDRPQYAQASAKLLNTFLLTMRGTPFCYYGDELGMSNINFNSIEQYKDIAALNAYKKARYKKEDMHKFMQNLKAFSRDNGRTPMQWDKSPYAGFSATQPWIATHPNKETVNVKTQQKDNNSVLNHFRSLTALRKQNPALIYGKYKLLLEDSPYIYAYTRTQADTSYLIMLNFSDNTQQVKIEEKIQINHIVSNNMHTLTRDNNAFTLAPYQAIICC